MQGAAIRGNSNCLLALSALSWELRTVQLSRNWSLAAPSRFGVWCDCGAKPFNPHFKTQSSAYSLNAVCLVSLF